MRLRLEVAAVFVQTNRFGLTVCPADVGSRNETFWDAAPS